MPTRSRPSSIVLIAVATFAAGSLAVAAPPASLAGATALVIRPENSFNGYDFTICAALMRRGFDVKQGQPNDLADPVKLKPYDLVVTNLKRNFTPEQVHGLKAYVAAGGAMYGNWGGPMGCPPLLAIGGVKNARSVYIHALTLLNSPLTAGTGAQRWVLP